MCCFTWLLFLFTIFVLTSPIQAVIAIRNMTCQHREFQPQRDDAERLYLYAQSVMYKHQALNASLTKAKSKSKHWKKEAKASVEKLSKQRKKGARPRRRLMLRSYSYAEFYSQV